MGVGLCASSSGIGWRSRNGGVRTADTIFHNRIERLGLGCNTVFWTGTRGRMGARLVAAFHSPRKGVQREGVVFTPRRGHGRDRLWLLTTYDVRNGRVEYVVVTAAFTANEIKICVVPDSEQHCKATITYRRSALAPEGNEDVAKLDEHWAEEQRIHWQSAINEALAKGGGIHD